MICICVARGCRGSSGCGRLIRATEEIVEGEEDISDESE